MPSMVVVAPGEPGVPVICWALAEGEVEPSAAKAKPLRMMCLFGFMKLIDWDGRVCQRVKRVLFRSKTTRYLSVRHCLANIPPGSQVKLIEMRNGR